MPPEHPSEKALVPPQRKGGSDLTPKMHEVLNFVEQEFLLWGELPTAAVAEARRVCTATTYKDYFRNPAFLTALQRRNVKVPGDSATPIGVLTEHQLIVANAMLDLRDNRSQKKKLTELNCSTAKWEAWLRDPTFQQYLRTRAENLLGDNLHESHLALLDRVRSGDINAIKYFNEITGRYVPNSTDKVDVNAILMRVLEIIQKHVTEPSALNAISEDLLSLSTIQQTVAANVSARPKVLQGHVVSSGGPLDL